MRRLQPLLLCTRCADAKMYVEHGSKAPPQLEHKLDGTGDFECGNYE